jgi:hypothetical protein
MKTLPPCDHDECPPTRCTRLPGDEAVVCKELFGVWQPIETAALADLLRDVDRDVAEAELQHLLRLERIYWHAAMAVRLAFFLGGVAVGCGVTLWWLR